MKWDRFGIDRAGCRQCANASEVVRAGLRALEQNEAEDRAKLEALCAAIQAGREGPLKDGGSVIADLKKQLARSTLQRHSGALTA